MTESEFLDQLNQHRGIIYKIVRLYSDSTLEGEDLYQEIVFQLWKSRLNFTQKSKFSTWMYQVALYTALTSIKNNKKTKEIKDNIEKPEETTTETDEDEVEKLYQIIKKLSKSDRALMMLYLDNKSYEEIAQIMGISTSNTGVKINRIKQKIKKLWN